MSTVESFKILYSYIDFEYSFSLISAMFLKYVTRYSRKSLRVLGSVGEPINPSAWRFVDLLPTVNNLCRHNYKRSYVCFTSFQMVLQYCWGFPVPHIRHLVANWNWWFHGMIFTVYTSCEIWYFLFGPQNNVLWTAVFDFFRSPLCLAPGLRNQVLQPFLSLVFR